VARYDEDWNVVDRGLRELDPRDILFRDTFVWFGTGIAESVGQLNLKTNGRLDAARSLLERVIATWESSTRAFPDDPRYRQCVAYSIALRGLARARAGDRAGAIYDRREAIPIMDSLPARTPGDLYHVACSRALLGASTLAQGSGIPAADA